MLSTTQGTVGNAPPPASLPTNWANTGEGIGATPTTGDGNPNGIVSITVPGTGITNDVPNVNFGIDQLPVPTSLTISARPNLAGSTTGYTVPPASFTGTDADGTISAVRYTAFPTNTTSLTIGSTVYTSANFPAGGVTATTGATVLLDPVDGSVTANIPFRLIDNAGQEGTTTGIVGVPFVATPDFCNSQVLFFNEDFGAGTGFGPPLSTTTVPGYTYRDTDPINDGQYGIVNNPDQGDDFATANVWLHGPDHTGNSNGRMLLINGSNPNQIAYSQPVSGLVVGRFYSLRTYIANVYNEAVLGTGEIKPNLILRVSDNNNNVLASVSTGDIPAPTTLTWLPQSMTFIASTSSVKFELVSNAPSGNGNDFALDDIQFFEVIQPVLSTTAVTSACPATSVSLAGVTASNQPASTTLTWHSSATATAANRISNVTALRSGTYYASFYDGTCFTVASPFVVLIVPCANPDAGLAISVGTSGTVVANVAANDLVNGQPATLGTNGNATVAQVGTYPTGVTLNTTTGSLSVAAGTAPGSYTVTYQLCDKLTPVNCTTTVATFTVSPAVSGTVFDDANGLTNNLIDGTGTNAGGLYAILTDAASTSVLANALVSNSGAYSFTGLTAGTYSVRLSTTSAVVGTTPPAASVPTGYTYTGEGTAAAGDGTPNGITQVTLTNTVSLTNVNFGLNQIPVPTTSTLASQVNPGGINGVSVPPTSFTGTDDGTVTAIRYTAFPSNVTSLTIGNTVYVASVGTGLPVGAVVFPAGGVTATTGTAVRIDPVDGAVTVSIPFRVIDNIGQESTATGAVNVPFTGLSVSGTVFDDANGLTDNTVNGTGTNAGGGLFANLVDVNGNVVAFQSVPSTGAYSFTGISAGVYSVRLSTTAGTVGSPAPAVSVPTGWTFTGEGTAASGDGTPNGSTQVTLTTTSVSGVNFGLDQLPTATSSTLASQANPGGTNGVTIAPSSFTGTDPDGTVASIRYTAFPTNTTSLTIGTTVYTAANFPTGGVTSTTGTAVAIDPVDGAVTAVIPFRVIDNAGVESANTASVSVPFTYAITATPDAGTVSSGTGGTAVANVAANDVVNGQPATLGTNGNATVATVGSYPTGITLNTTTGSVSVAQGTAPGSYTVAYQLCDKLSTPTCTTTTAVITVTPSVTATPDAGTVSSGTGGTAVPNVATNDVVNGQPATLGTGGNATVATIGTYPTGITLNTTTGSVSVAQGTTPGSYTVAYQLCDKLSTPTCTTTIVSLTVTSAVVANPDAGLTLSAGTSGTVVANVAANDLVNGQPATLGTNGNATVAQVGTYPTGVTLNTTTGSLSVAAGTAPGSYTVAYQLCDKLTPATCSTAIATFSVTPTLSGTVFNDANGLTDNLINGTGTNAGGLFAILTNAASTSVLANVAVNSNGTYSFTGLTAGTYSVRLSTTSAVVGTTPPAASAPTGYTFTGEGTAATGDGSPDGSTQVTLTSTANLTGVNFGLDQLPTPTTATLAAQANPGGVNGVSIPPASFTGTDPDGSVASIRYTAFPTNVTSMTIGTTLYTALTFPAGGVTAATGTAVTIDPTDGNVTVVIPFRVIDNAGQESTTTATLSVPFTGLSVSGTVFDDANGLTDNLINGTGTNAGGLFVSLVDATGNVAAVQALPATGVYSFSNVATGVYSVRLSTTTAAVGNPAPAISLPTGWTFTGEGTAAAGDGTPNGSTQVTLTTASVAGVNFGLDQLPTATSAILTAQANPGGTTGVAIAPASFTGTDPDGTVASIRYTAFPTNVDSFTIGTTVYTSASFPAGGVTAVTGTTVRIDPKDGALTAVLPFRVIDNAGVESANTASVSVPFTYAITATPDAGTVSSGTGGTAVPNVAANDVVNGQPATLGTNGNATVATVGTYPTGITLNPATGSLSVAAGTAPGSYTVAYQLCDKLSTPTCTTTTAVITVTPSVTATPDAGTVSSGTGGTAVPNVAANDVVNGQPATLGAGGNATVATVGTYPAGITLNPATGSVSVAQGTTPGSYTIAYQLCDKLSTPTCTTTTAVITVTPSVTATPDAGTVSSGTGGTAVPNVAANDVVNGQPATLGTGGNATVAQVGTYPPGVTLNTTTGSLSVAAGTTPGSYTVAYQLCDKLTPATCSTAIVSFTVTPSSVAMPDAGTVSSGTGGTAVANIASNDVVNGQPATLGTNGNATVSQVGTYPTGITLNPATGSVSVAQGTAPGSYTVAYQLCDKLSTPTCTTTTALITVTPSVTATPDAGVVSSGTGGTAVTNVAANDVVNGQPATLGTGGNATVATIGTYPAGITLNTTTGSVSVAQGTTPGSYTVAYQLCDKLTPATCSTAIVSLTVTSAVVANPDAGLTLSAGTSGTVVANVAANDLVNGQPATLGTNGNATVAQVGTYPTGVTLNTTTGSLSVAAGTAPGSYTVAYQLCDKLTPATCSTAIATFSVTPTLSGTVFNDANGLTDNLINGTGTNAGGLFAILTNATSTSVLASVPVNSSGAYSFTGLTAGTYSVRLSTTSAVVGTTPPAASAPTGYTFTGEGTAATGDGSPDGSTQVTLTNTANITGVNFGLDQLPTPTTATLAAQANPGGVNGVSIPPASFTGTDPDGAIAAIRYTAFPSNVTSMTIGTTLYTALTFPAGGVTAATGTAVTIDPTDGNVTAVIPFRVIDNAGQESTTTATLSVPFTGLSVSGTVFDDANGLTDNLINGTGTNANGLFVSLVDATGNVAAVQALPATGVYSFSNVATGVYSVRLSTTTAAVGSPAPTISLPTGYTFTGEGTAAAGDGTPNGSTQVTLTTASVAGVNFGLDQLPTATSAILTAQANPGGTTGVAIAPASFTGTDPDGTVASIRYTAFPTNVDSFTIGTTVYTSANFPAGGVTAVTGSSVRIDPKDGALTAVLPFRVIDNAGVESSTATTASVSVPFTYVITASPDAGTASAGTGGTAVANVAANDLINGQPATLGTNGNATVTTVGTYPTGITLNPATGSISVAQGTVPGSYTVAYQLCDKLTPTTCSTATVTVTVAASVTASPDAGTVNAGTGGGTPVANVAANDVVNGQPATLGANGNATVATVGTYPAGITLDPATGSLSVAQGTAPGSYTVAYQLCDKLTPATCSTAIVSFTVTPSSVAIPDAGTVNAGTGGTPVTNVAANDLVNGQPATLGNGGNATVAQVGTYPPGVTLNPATGSLSVAQGTAPGSYTVAYQLCDKLTPTTCSTAIVSFTVTPSVTATPDAGTVSSGTGGTAVPNVAANDVVNGQPATLGAGGNATVATVGTYPAGITLNTTTGSVSVAQGTTPGSYTIAYQLCDKLSTPTCTTTTAVITVTPSVTATPDAGTVSSGTGGTAVANVAANDVVNGQPATLGNGGNATVITVGTYPTGITLNPATGSISVAQGTVPGSYTVAYQLCDKLTPTTCSTATVTVTVTASVTASPDAGTVNAGTGGTPVANVSANDLVNGQPATLGTNGNATVTQVGTYPTGVTLNPATGSLSVAAGTAPGSYTVAYQLCDKLTPATCSTAIVSFTVTASSVATPDAGTVSNGTGGTPVANVAANDLVNGQPATLGTNGNATVAQVGTYPTGVTLDPTTGSLSVAAGTAPGSYTVAYQLCDKLTPATCSTAIVSFTVTPSVGGTVFSDPNGLTDNTINGTGTNVGGLFVTLVDGNNTVVSSVSVSPTGTYRFDNVAPGTYGVRLSTTSAVVGAAPPAASVPTGYTFTGEGTAPAGDGTPNGITSIAVTATATPVVNFGIEQLPTPTSTTLVARANPGGTNAITVPPSSLTGTDPDGVVTAIHYISFPTYTTTLYIGSTAYTAATFPVGGVTAASNLPVHLDPANDANGVGTSVISFRVIDNAGVESTATATATIPFTCTTTFCPPVTVKKISSR